MKKIDVAQTIGVRANLGVLMGIVFLAVEIRQNTEALQIQLSTTRNERQTEDIAEFYRNADLRDAYIKFASGEQLTEHENFILSAMALRVFVTWEWQYSQRGPDAFPSIDRLRESFYGNLVGGVSSPVFSHSWDTYRDTLIPEFRAWMEEAVIAE